MNGSKISIRPVGVTTGANKPNAHQIQSAPYSDTASAAFITFPIKEQGYDPDQVDRYLQKLVGEYTNLQQSYNDLADKYESEPAGQPDADMETIGRVLVEAQQNASKILADAREESEAKALRIIADAKAEASDIIQEARQDLAIVKNEKTQLIADINDIVNRLDKLGLLDKPVSVRKPVFVGVA